MQAPRHREPRAAGSKKTNKRKRDVDALVLVQLNPMDILDGERVDEGFVVGEIRIAGEAREMCPACGNTHLKLVLRQKHVKHEHMFCEQCTRCFDARYPDGTSALLIAK